MPRDSLVYKRAVERVLAIRRGCPCDMSKHDKLSLYAELRGLAPYIHKKQSYYGFNGG